MPALVKRLYWGIGAMVMAVGLLQVIGRSLLFYVGPMTFVVSGARVGLMWEGHGIDNGYHFVFHKIMSPIDLRHYFVPVVRLHFSFDESSAIGIPWIYVAVVLLLATRYVHGRLKRVPCSGFDVNVAVPPLPDADRKE